MSNQPKIHSITEEDLDELLPNHLRDYIAKVLDSSPLESSVVKISLTKESPEFALLCSSYASLRNQGEESKRNDKLTKQNIRLQLFLGVFAAISAIGTLVQALIAAHVIG